MNSILTWIRQAGFPDKPIVVWRWLLLFLALASLVVAEEQATDVMPKGSRIDSEIEVECIRAITKSLTVREFLCSLGLCSKDDPPEEIWSLVRLCDRESMVNTYKLRGGGGVGFTTGAQVQEQDRESVGQEAYLEAVLDSVVTSYWYGVDQVTALMVLDRATKKYVKR